MDTTWAASAGLFNSAGRSRTYTQADLDSLDRLARLLDAQWRIPGTSIRFGADLLAGFVPGIGDITTGAIGSYIIYRAFRMGVPVHILALMGLNIAFDTAVGTIPAAGTVVDLFFRANIRNMWLLRRHIEGSLGKDTQPR